MPVLSSLAAVSKTNLIFMSGICSTLIPAFTSLSFQNRIIFIMGRGSRLDNCPIVMGLTIEGPCSIYEVTGRSYKDKFAFK